MNTYNINIVFFSVAYIYSIVWTAVWGNIMLNGS